MEGDTNRVGQRKGQWRTAAILAAFMFGGAVVLLNIAKSEAVEHMAHKELFGFLVSEVLRDVALAMFPLGCIAVVFELFGRHELLQTVFSAMNDAVERTFAVREVKEANRKLYGLADLQSRADLENGSLGFYKILEQIIDRHRRSGREFLLVGSTFRFISVDRLHLIEQAISRGAHLKVLIGMPLSFMVSEEQNVRNLHDRDRALALLQEICIRSSGRNWKGRIEVRTTPHVLENSFTSFIDGHGIRTSVLECKLGSDRQEWVQIFKHYDSDSCYARDLFLMNSARFNSGRREVESYAHLKAFPATVQDPRIEIYIAHGSKISVLQTDGSLRAAMIDNALRIPPEKTPDQCVSELMQNLIDADKFDVICSYFDDERIFYAASAESFNPEKAVKLKIEYLTYEKSEFLRLRTDGSKYNAKAISSLWKLGEFSEIYSANR